MFVIMASAPRYDNRDGICGSHRWQAVANTYETLGLAFRMVPNPCDEEGNPLDEEVSYYVTDTSDIYRRPIYRELPADDGSNDIAF